MMSSTKILLTIFIACTVKFDVIISSTDHWPLGSYTMPKPKSGCPHTNNITWKESWRLQDLENDAKQRSKFSSNFNMDAKIINNDLKRGFCTIINEGVQEPWPQGSYCIYRNSNNCPPNMTQGFIAWYDEQTKNKNRFHNYLSLPDGIYFGPSTRLLYCCHTTGKWYKSVELPTEKPFYLLPYGSGNCQRVVGAISSLEYIVYDTEDEKNWDQFDGDHVFTDKVKSLPKVFYCYYEGCQHQLRNSSGSFTSQNFHNGSFPDFQQCSWSINLSVSSRILLKFQTLQVPSCEENYLDIYDGGSAKGSKLLARFCGGNATTGANVISTTNYLHIVLKSGNNSAKNSEDLSKRLRFHAEYEDFKAATPNFPTKFTTEKRTQSTKLSTSTLSSRRKAPGLAKSLFTENIVNFGKETSPTTLFTTTTKRTTYSEETFPTTLFTTTRKRTTYSVRRRSTDNVYTDEKTNSQTVNMEYSSIHFLIALPILGILILLVVIGTTFYWIRSKKKGFAIINDKKEKIEKTAV